MARLVVLINGKIDMIKSADQEVIKAIVTPVVRPMCQICFVHCEGRPDDFGQALQFGGVWVLP